MMVQEPTRWSIWNQDQNQRERTCREQEEIVSIQQYDPSSGTNLSHSSRSS